MEGTLLTTVGEEDWVPHSHVLLCWPKLEQVIFTRSFRLKLTKEWCLNGELDDVASEGLRIGGAGIAIRA